MNIAAKDPRAASAAPQDQPSVPRFVAHFAIPSHDLDAAVGFYKGVLGCRPARRYHDRQTFEFYTHQIVCHLTPDEVSPEPAFYPRHFGITFLEKRDFAGLVRRVEEAGATFFHPPDLRFVGLVEEHSFFALVDPSNNVIEFKHYPDTASLY